MRTAGSVLIAIACSAAIARAQDAPRADMKAIEETIVKTDQDFNDAVGDRDLTRFLSYVAENAIFNGGRPDEVRGRDAVGAAWAQYFAPGGPTLTWSPTRVGVLAGGELGYTVGSWQRLVRAQDGTITETHGNYLTVWRKDAAGRWRAVYDTGSAEP